MKWLNIILDIDGTLIDPENGPSARPHLQRFLHQCFDHCLSVNLWTAAPEEWLTEVLATIIQPLLREDDKFTLLWSGNRCSESVSSLMLRDFDYYTPRIVCKNLKKLWRLEAFTKTNTLIVDDTASTYINNYGNAVPISSYSVQNEGEDKALFYLGERLRRLEREGEGDARLRKVDKRGWCNSC